jgi:hypothetical protein
MPRIDLGDVYLIDSPPNGNHFYVAMMRLNNGSYLFVNYSTVQDFTPDEELHFTISPSSTLPFINRESYFVYSRVREISESKLDEMKKSSCMCDKKGAFSPSILKKIQLAGLVSKSLKNKYKKQLRDLNL